MKCGRKKMCKLAAGRTRTQAQKAKKARWKQSFSIDWCLFFVLVQLLFIVGIVRVVYFVPRISQYRCVAIFEASSKTVLKMTTNEPSMVPSMMPMMMPGDDMMDMTDMVMTFGDWDDYKLKLLFEGWDIEEKWQFALSWFAVMFAVIVYHYLKCQEGKLEEHMYATMRNDQDDSNVNTGLIINNRGMSVDKSGNKTQSSYFKKLRVAHAVLAGILYALGLMLMLVVMTYNPSLFLAVVVGFIIGDFIFFHKRNFATLDNGDMGCH
jgi:hypothetical protein